MSNKENKKDDSLSTMQSFGERLQSAFGDRTYREITDYLNKNGLKVDYDTVRRYLINERSPNYETLIEISEIVGVSVDWLLKGKPDNEKVKSASNPIINALSNLSLEQSKLLKELAESAKKPISLVVQELLVEGLKIRGLTSKLFDLPFFSMRGNSVDIEVWGEIVGDNQLNQIHEKGNVPKQILQEYFGTLKKKPHPNTFHSYRVKTNKLSPQGINNGDLIVSANFLQMLEDWNDTFNSIPILAHINQQEVVICRVYQDILDNKKYFHRPIRMTKPIGRLPDIKLSDFEWILGIVVTE